MHKKLTILIYEIQKFSGEGHSPCKILDPRLFIHLWAHGLRKGDEHPAYTPSLFMGYGTFLYLYLTYTKGVF